ncbi:MAG: FhaA domain-containing protein [Frankia sp.]
MGVLQRFERRLGGLVEGAFAKVFKGGVEPVEIASALARETDDRRAISANRTLVPNEFAVELASGDYTRLAPYKSALCDELAAMVREHAAEQRYTFVGPVSIRLAEASDLDVGVFRIRSSVAAADAGGFPNRGASGRTGRGGPSRPRLVITTKPSGGGAGSEREYVLDSEVALIGRSVECEIRLNDTGVSRKHAEIRRMPDGRHVFADLGSTNGSLVNGRPASQARLADGDRVEVGNTVIVYRNEEQRPPSRERRPGPPDAVEADPRDPYGSRGGYGEPDRGGRDPGGFSYPPAPDDGRVDPRGDPRVDPRSDPYGGRGAPDPYRSGPPPAADPYAGAGYRQDGVPDRPGYGAPARPGAPEEYDETVGPRRGDPYAEPERDPYGGRGGAPDPYAQQRPDPYRAPADPYQGNGDPYQSRPGTHREPPPRHDPQQYGPPPGAGEPDPYWQQQRDDGYPPADPYARGPEPGPGPGGSQGPVYGDVRDARHRRGDVDDSDPRGGRHEFPDRSW